jgi:hypothetical protein
MLNEAAFETRHLDELDVHEQPALRKVPYYEELKEVLRQGRVPFRLFPEASRARADHALLLNVVFWDAGAVDDIIERPLVGAYSIPHIAWHYLTARALAPAPGRLSAGGWVLGESIASAFDLFLLGHLLREDPGAPTARVIVDRLHAAVLRAGGSDDQMRSLAGGARDDPEAAFADLRELLFVGTQALLECERSDDAFAVLRQIDAQPLGCLFHAYRVADWVLQVKASGAKRDDEAVDRLDAELRAQRAPVAWLIDRWLTPAERAKGAAPAPAGA